MKLQDSLHEAVADLDLDVTALVASSRRRGLALRRRRRALTTVGTAAAAVALGGTVWAAHPGDGSHVSPTVQVDDLGFAASPTSAATVPPTGKAAAAALAAAVSAAADGTASGFAGQTPIGNRSVPPDPEYYAEVMFRPAGMTHAAKVAINVQLLSEAPKPYSCEGEAASHMTDCSVTTLPSGDILRTYDDLISGSGRGYRRVVAELISPSRGMRLVVGAGNDSDSKSNIVSATAVLDRAQVSAIAEQPWWSLVSLPAEYADGAAKLPSYRDLGGNGDAWPLKTPPIAGAAPGH